MILTFMYVPKKARWEHISQFREDIGTHINKAFEVLEEENPNLEGVLVNIDFKERLPSNVLDEAYSYIFY